MASTDNNPFLGTELKLNLNIEPLGKITMDDYDFYVDVYCSPKNTITFKKEELIRVDNSNYIILIDSAKIGAGEIKCKVTAYIPDADFDDGLRTEVIGIETGINIVKNI